jgi:hypothetical protein
VVPGISGDAERAERRRDVPFAVTLAGEVRSQIDVSRGGLLERA